jgi:PAS domain-containing protein
MATKRTYEELEKRVKELENEVLELKQAEEALRLSHANLSALLENTSDYSSFAPLNWCRSAYSICQYIDIGGTFLLNFKKLKDP